MKNIKVENAQAVRDLLDEYLEIKKGRQTRP
jgi:hypothetical protein